nr:unnamed protein product [Callosobruchus chinensis]
MLEGWETSHSKRIMIVGDFNCTRFVEDNLNGRKTCAISNFLTILDVQQYNTILNSYNRMLDLIISKTNCIITRDCSPLIIEDPYHPALSIELKNVYVRHVSVNSASSYKRYNFTKANYVTLYEDLVSTNWDFMQNINDSTQALQCFYDKLYVILDTHVPLYVISSKTIKCSLCTQIFHLVWVGLKDNLSNVVIQSDSLFWFCDERKVDILLEILFQQ